VPGKRAKKKVTTKRRPAARRKGQPKKAHPLLRLSPKPIRSFKTPQDFAAWLESNHAKSPGIWARIAKKGSGLTTITYAEGLDVALCYGWIDAHKLPENEKSWLQRFLPRRPKSGWSKINRNKALSLIEAGRMRPPGLAEIERAKGDGRWDSAYDSPAKATVPPEFEAELDKNSKAKAFFETISKTNRYAIIWRLQTAKTSEARAARMKVFIDMLEKGKTLH
jgi:uncharacterized protein YdeI (YjbR/CyaY-like superfamily)